MYGLKQNAKPSQKHTSYESQNKIIIVINAAFMKHVYKTTGFLGDTVVGDIRQIVVQIKRMLVDHNYYYRNSRLALKLPCAHISFPLKGNIR